MHLVQSMAYVGDTPWHGLGNPLAANQPLEVWARQAGMDWRIEEAEVRFVSGMAGTSLGSIHAFPEQKSTLPLGHEGSAVRCLVALSGGTA
ncbi:hypothetical protein LMG9964_04696 [Paraburkholderia phenoliruptrix]|uniref:Uncharacterized protein n=1 Tax=Paraburkholderia phenoliruptrix TaxID=252970 RepID=A0A6J5KAZ5_9BURK|nr:hypothetical protein LMG9964_04696 [Paraburkholderia phenoliruptrix]